MSLLPWVDQLASMSQRLGPGLARELAALVPPPVAPLAVEFPRPRVDDLDATLAREFARPEIGGRLRPGARVALLVGSRGIARLPEIVRGVVRELRARGASPYIVPAMGSHGGATAEGQAEVLAGYGITEASVGAPIVSSLDVEVIGHAADGVPVYASVDALRADAIVPIARIKPHTGFRGEIESGLMKMLTIGLGKQRGAETLHAQGMERFATLIPAAGEVVLARAPVAFGIAVVENAYEEIARLVAVPAAAFAETERALLREARALMPQLPFATIDLLVVGALGKNISGAGIDPNVVGRFFRGAPPGVEVRPEIRRIAVLDVTAESHGNSVGLGMADVIPLRLLQKTDLPSVYANSLTAASLAGAKIPVVMESDRMAIAAGLKACPRVEPATARLCVIRNTLEIHEIWASPPLVDEVAGRDGIRVRGPARPLEFDADGNLVWPLAFTTK